MKSFVLASASPRRREILKREGYTFEVVPSEREEVREGSPKEIAEKNACIKAKDVFSRLNGERIVLGADTVVAIDGKVLGKPKDAVCAKEMLETLSGRTHEVITGFAIISKDGEIVGAQKSEVTFNDLSEELIDGYIASGLCYGKAGAYGIQDGYPLVKEYSGDYDNVVGLPIKKISEIFKESIK